MNELPFLAIGKPEIELQQNVCYGPLTAIPHLQCPEIRAESNIAYGHTSFTTSGRD